MIQVNELRIGNKAKIIALGQIIEIESISRVNDLSGLFTWVHEGEEYEDSLTAIESVALTPEILDQYGFLEIDDDGLFQHQEFKHIRLQNRYLANDGYDVYINKKPIDVILDSLHQLQNLFRALTSKELTS